MLKQVKPQQTALLGGFLLLFSSGIHIGYGFFQWTDVDVPWTKSTSSTLIAFAVVAWYIGSIFAFALAPMSLKFFNRQMIYVSRPKNREQKTNWHNMKNASKVCFISS